MKEVKVIKRAILIIGAMCACFAFLLSNPAYASVYGIPPITIEHEDLEGIIYKAVDEEVVRARAICLDRVEKCKAGCRSSSCEDDCNRNCPEKHIWWKNRTVEIKKSNKSYASVEADLDLKTHWSIPVDLDIYLAFGCNWKKPGIRVSVSRVHYKVNTPVIWDFLTGGLTQLIANFIAVHNVDLSDAMNVGVNIYLSDYLPIDLCPIFEAQSNGDVVAKWVTGNNCTNGHTRHTDCGSGLWGPGHDYVCVNGYWQLDTGFCEPLPPDDGDPY